MSEDQKSDVNCTEWVEINSDGKQMICKLKPGHRGCHYTDNGVEVFRWCDADDAEGHDCYADPPDWEGPAPTREGTCERCARAAERMPGRAASPWTCPDCGTTLGVDGKPTREET